MTKELNVAVFYLGRLLNFSEKPAFPFSVFLFGNKQFLALLDCFMDWHVMLYNLLPTGYNAVNPFIVVTQSVFA